MALFRTGRHPPRYAAVLFLVVAVTSVTALIWMGMRLVQQDRSLELQRLEEQRETAADRIIIAMEKVLAEEERQLDNTPWDRSNPKAEDFFLIIIRSGEFRALPENSLLYYPESASGREASSSLFAAAERAEFLEKDYGRAIIALRSLTTATDPALRAGAQLRLARNLRKAGQLSAALDIYRELTRASEHGISISGVPADLVARRASCVLLEELGIWEKLRQEAKSLLDGLIGRQWRLDRASYLYYRSQVAQWIDSVLPDDSEQRALADAVIWLWQNRLNLGSIDRRSSGRRSLSILDKSVVVLWRLSNNRLEALVVGPGYQQSHWFEPVFGSKDFKSNLINMSDSSGTFVYGSEPTDNISVTRRPGSTTGLPWDINLFNAEMKTDMNEFAQRRRFIIAGLAMLSLFVIAASYLIGRAVSRELAAAQLQSDFVSAVSHEFRTPLTSMRQFTEMLVEDENIPEGKRRAYYQAQERATRRLSRLVESLLDFGRMEAGARPYRLERLDIGRMVRRVVEEFKLETDSNNLVMDCDIPDKGTKVNADREALAQALWNLLDNAVKYSGENPVVLVEVRVGNQVAIYVRDQGPGIPRSEKNRIFRKFTRGSSAEKLGIKGTGIGLAMVKHIVDAHGGKVLVDSVPGNGSAFTILLPLGG
jgi:two-component system phosphate regulon sensor histidine kinase PhoR